MGYYRARRVGNDAGERCSGDLREDRTGHQLCTPLNDANVRTLTAYFFAAQ